MKLLDDIGHNLRGPQSRLFQRSILAFIIIIDAYIGLLYSYGILNILDMILQNNLPNDLVWLLQTLQAISGGFIIVKILFDDVKEGRFRSISIATSPLLLLFIILLTLEFLFKGLEEDALIRFNFASIAINTLNWASTYLAIAVALTLTYKVQRYGNFAQSELFMIGMYLALIMTWTDYFFPLSGAPMDGTLAWSLLIWTLLAAFVLTGIAGIIIDRLVYSGFRKKKATPQVMMIASLGVALILRGIIYLRFTAGARLFEPDADWRVPQTKWDFPTYYLRLNLGDRSVADGSYTSQNCKELTSRPLFEIYNHSSCNDLTQSTVGLSYYKAMLPIVVFTSVIILLILLKKSRLGRRMRAVADNPDLAASSGINIERIQMTSAFLAAGISGMGGAIFGMTFRFSPETPFTLLLPSFAVIVLGTIGSIPGALIGSILIGFVRSFSHPIMTGVGQSLPGSRSNYSALPEIMPFVFLVAVLLIMPEGIGNVYDKWKVNRLRKRAEKRAKNIDIPSKKIGLILAIFFGWLGLHNFQQRKSARGESMMIITSVAYLFSKFTEFVSNNSFAKGTCNDKCLQLEKESNLDMLDRNNDGVINILDAPFTLDDVPTPPSDLAPYLHPEWSTNALESMNQSWLTLINFEIDFIQALVYLGDIVWPVIPIVVWLIALSEGYSMFYGNDKNQVNLIFQQYLNRISQKYTKLKSSISSHYSIKGPIKIIRKIIYGISQIPLLYSQYIKQFDKNMLWILFPLVLVSSSFILKASGFILLFSLIVMYSITRMSDRSIIEEYHFRTPYGKESPFGSTMLFCSLMIIILLLIIWLPVSDGPNQSNFTKTSQVSQILALISIYALWSFTLNLHTGITGMTNFGIVFFAAIGTVTVGLLTAPSHLGGYDWSVLTAVVASIILAASIGWILAYPTARLRMDYFAIVTISLGEILRVLLKSEPLLRAGTAGSSIGISGYKKPLETWWFCGKNPPINEFTGNISSPLQCRDVVGIGSFAEKLGRSDIPKLDGTGEIIVGEFVYEAAAYSMNLGQPAPYILVLAGIGIFSTAFVWILLSILLKSPWGRILRAIREDEDVAQHHGHDVLTHKAASLALGAAIAALGGVIWAWHLNGFQDSILSPAKTTFLVWAMFIIGGSGNNKGMIFGASLIWITDVIFRKLQAAQGSTSQPLWETAESIDNLFQWLVIDSFEIVKIFIFILIFGWISHRQYLIDIGISGATIFLFTGYIMVQRTIDEVYSGGQVKVTMAYVQLILVGCVLLFSLKNNPKGVLPEVPNRPHRPSKGGVK